jgi:predicted phosphate transport protein (TIGR00153 family)
MTMVSIRLMPRDEKFFEIFISDGENLASGAQELAALMQTYDRLDERVARIQAIEHAGDELGNEVIARLERAFITPMDRGDIHELARRMDDVLDRIQEIAETLQIYDIKAPTEEARRLSAILAEQTTEILAALRKLESMKGLDDSLKRVHVLENEADGLSRAAIGRLFREATDPLDVIKWRDVYLALEESIDAAEDVAEIIARMVHKNS